jgi:hypothetical protein
MQKIVKLTWFSHEPMQNRQTLLNSKTQKSGSSMDYFQILKAEQIDMKIYVYPHETRNLESHDSTRDIMHIEAYRR